MHLLIIANSRSVFTSRYANEFIERGHKVSVLSATPFDGKATKYHEQVNHINYFSSLTRLFNGLFPKRMQNHNPENSGTLHPKNFLILFRMMYLFFAINSINRKEKFDAVLAINLTTNGIFAARIRKKIPKLIATLGCDLFFAKWPSTQTINNNTLVYKYVYKRITNIISGVEQQYYDFFKHPIFMGGKKVIHLPGMGIKTKLFSPDYKSNELRKQYYKLEPTDVLGLCIRQPRPNLDFEGLIERLVPVFKQHPNFYFAIGTGGRSYPPIDALIEKHGLQRQLILMDMIPYADLHKYIAQGDIFLDPCNVYKYPETAIWGISVSVLESMACGLIPIIMDKPGLEMYFNERFNELIYEDSDEALEKAVQFGIRKVNDVRYKDDLREIIIEKSSWEKNVDRFQEILSGSAQ